MQKMKKMMNDFVEKMTGRKALVILGIFIIIWWLIDFSPIGVARLEEITGGVGILDFETRYSADFAYNWLESMGEAGRKFHLTRIMPLDIIFPPCFALMQFAFIAILMKAITNNGSWVRCFAVFPVFYTLLDWMENICLTTVMINYPIRLDALAVTCGWITSIKKTVILIDIILIIVHFVLLLNKKIKGVFNAKIKR